MILRQLARMDAMANVYGTVRLRREEKIKMAGSAAAFPGAESEKLPRSMLYLYLPAILPPFIGEIASNVYRERPQVRCPTLAHWADDALSYFQADLRSCQGQGNALVTKWTSGYIREQVVRQIYILQCYLRTQFLFEVSTSETTSRGH